MDTGKKLYKCGQYCYMLPETACVFCDHCTEVFWDNSMEYTCLHVILMLWISVKKQVMDAVILKTWRSKKMDDYIRFCLNCAWNDEDYGCTCPRGENVWQCDMYIHYHPEEVEKFNREMEEWFNKMEVQENDTTIKAQS